MERFIVGDRFTTFAEVEKIQFYKRDSRRIEAVRMMYKQHALS